MNKEELFKAFQELFPEWAANAHSYKKIGSRVLAITFKITHEYENIDRSLDEDVSRVFLYNNQNNWQFGTKLWRKRPERLNKKVKKQEEETHEE